MINKSDNVTYSGLTGLVIKNTSKSLMFELRGVSGTGYR